VTFSSTLYAFRPLRSVLASNVSSITDPLGPDSRGRGEGVEGGGGGRGEGEGESPGPKRGKLCRIFFCFSYFQVITGDLHRFIQNPELERGQSHQSCLVMSLSAAR
jgi:hypothetical protein